MRCPATAAAGQNVFAMTEPNPGMPRRQPARGGLWRNPRVIIGVVALVISFAGFGWTLDGYFLGDDFGYVGRFFEYPLARWPHLWVQSWAGNLWGFELRELRPITALSFMVDSRLWEGNAFGFRATNLLLHAGCAAMVGLLAWRAAGRELGCGLGAAILFALHPAHAEAVQWITGRVDVLATAFYLAGFCAFLRYRDTIDWRWAAGVGGLYAAAAFSKEFGLTLPLMLLIADATWLTDRRRWRESRTWLPYAFCVAVVIAYYFCRRAAFGPGGMGAGWPNLRNSDFYAQLAQRQLTYVGNLFPGFERWLGEGGSLLSGHVLRTFLLVGAGGLAVVIFWRWGAVWREREERRAGVFFGLGWYAVATLPLVVTYISSRHLYLASAGLCVALTLGLRGLLYSRGLFVVATLALAAFYARRLPVTMRPWHDAALVSGKVSRELRRLEPEVQPGSALLLDVPEITRGAYVWTWAVPSVLRPPFTRKRLDDGGVVVLESRGNYNEWDRWHEQPAVAALARVEKPSWLVQIADGKPLRRIAVSPEKLRPAAEEFAHAPLKQLPHESWRKLINQLAPP